MGDDDDGFSVGGPGGEAQPAGVWGLGPHSAPREGQHDPDRLPESV